MQNMPFVSVVIPSYNHEKYVSDSIKSVLNQTYKNIELIVIDDGSKDNSVSIIQKLADEYKFKFIHRPNKGLCATLNEGLNLANGKYFCAVASDDKFILDKIEKQVKFMEENPDVAVCCGNHIEFNENYENKISLKFDKKYDFETMLEFDLISAPTAMIKSEVLKSLGGYDENMIIEDLDMWLRITHVGYKIAHIDEYLAYYRKHATNTTANYAKMVDGVEKVLQKWDYDEKFKKIADRRRLLLFGAYARNDKATAKRYLNLAFSNIYKWQTFKGIVKYYFF